MKTVASHEFRERIAELSEAAEVEPIAISDDGTPWFVMMSVGEFVRLKTASGEALPAALLPYSEDGALSE